jgi:hypothetical protein
MQLRNGKRVCSNLDLSNSVKRFKLRPIDEMANPKQVDSPDWDVNREDFTDSSDSSPTRLTIDETADSTNQQLEEPKPEPETVPEEPKHESETVPEEPKPEQPETVQTERKPTAASCVRSKPPKLQCSDNLSARDIMERLMDYVSRMPLIQNEATVPETTNQTKPETDIVTAEEPKPESVESKPETVTAEEPKPESVESKPETVTAEPKPEPEPETVEPKPEPKPETVEPKPEPEPVPYDSVEDCDPDEFAEDMESESDSSGSEECEDSEDEYYESSD